jgi:large subunit ribosomal protein L19
MADLSKDQLKANPPVIRVGDSVRVGLAVTEGKGKTRTQKLEGVIIAESGSGIDKTFVLRRVFQGVGIEFNLHVHSPIVQYVETFRVGKVRRAKLHYLRDRIGKAAKLKEIVGKNKVSK